MSLAVILGLAVGIFLNACADRLPHTKARRPLGVRGFMRWSIVLTLSVGLVAYLQRTYDWSLAFTMRTTYCSLLLLIATIDFEHRLIPNVLVGSGMLLALVFNVFYRMPGLAPALWGAVVGGGTFCLLALARRDALGMGDVKLAALIGMMTGFPSVLQALTIGVILGGLAAGLLLLTRVRTGKQYMPYGPYLVAGGMATLLHGQSLAQWYASLIR